MVAEILIIVFTGPRTLDENVMLVNSLMQNVLIFARDIKINVNLSFRSNLCFAKTCHEIKSRKMEQVDQSTRSPEMHFKTETC